MPRKRETPTGFQHTDDADLRVSTLIGHGSTRPMSMIEALMQCAPGDVPETSLEELEPLRAILDNAEAQLALDDQWIFHALYTRGLSERQVQRETLALAEAGLMTRPLPRRTIRRRRDLILRQLRSILEAEPMVLDYLHRGEFE